MKTYCINKSVGCFEDFNVLLIAISSVHVAANFHLGMVADCKPGDYCALSGRLLSDKEVRLPLFGPVESALKGLVPNVIQITVADISIALPQYQCNTSGFAGLIESVFQPFFVNYYERYLDGVRASFGDSDTQWPASWQMGWIVRNAISHNGCVYFRNQGHAAVTWEGLTLSYADNGSRLIHNLLSVADLIILLLKMEEDRTSTTIPFA